MLLDQVDAEDRVVGTVARKDVFRFHAGFRVVHVFLFRDKETLLLQRLASTRERHPLRWGSSVAAYLFAGEGYEEAAQRRLREELGIAGVELEPRGRTIMFDQGCRKHIMLFSGIFRGQAHPDPMHIAELREVGLNEVSRLAESDPDAFTPTFRYLLGHVNLGSP
jgi:isopentenyl-diphosphate delta-isomerase